MTQVRADIEALKSLRSALIRFAQRQTEALEATEREIARKEKSLEDEEKRCRREVQRHSQRLQACLAAARAAAAKGGQVDCSPERASLHEAERELEQVRRRVVEVKTAAERYRRVAQRVQAMLHEQLPHATSFLQDRITALEAYYAAQIDAATASFASLGMPEIVGSVIGAMRHTKGELSRVIGAVGEEIAAQVLTERFGLRQVAFDQPKHGFDRVFSAPGMPLVVVESKVSSTGNLRLQPTKSGEQLSPGWIAASASRMADRSSAQWSPINSRIAGLVEELGPDNIPVVAVTLNPNTNTADVYWRIGTGSWQLLEQGIALK